MKLISKTKLNFHHYTSIPPFPLHTLTIQLAVSFDQKLPEKHWTDIFQLHTHVFSYSQHPIFLRFGSRDKTLPPPLHTLAPPEWERCERSLTDRSRRSTEIGCRSGKTELNVKWRNSDKLTAAVLFHVQVDGNNAELHCRGFSASDVDVGSCKIYRSVVCGFASESQPLKGSSSRGNWNHTVSY